MFWCHMSSVGNSARSAGHSSAKPRAHRAEESMPAVPSGGVDTLSLEVFGASGEGLGIKGCWLFINLGKRIRRKLLIEERIALQDKL